MAKRFAKFTDEELERLQKYTDYDDSMYSEILEEFKDRKYKKEIVLKSICKMWGDIMTEMDYENYCEMLSVMDKPIKMKTVTLNSDIVDGKQRQHVDWNNLNIRRNKLIEDIKNGEEIPHVVICK